LSHPDLSLAEFPNDLLRRELPPSWHLLLSLGLRHQRFSLRKWRRLRGAGQNRLAVLSGSSSGRRPTILSSPRFAKLFCASWSYRGMLLFSRNASCSFLSLSGGVGTDEGQASQWRPARRGPQEVAEWRTQQLLSPHHRRSSTALGLAPGPK
jgi:hypothetical protein